MAVRPVLRAALVATAILATVLDLSPREPHSALVASEPAPQLPGSWLSVANGDRINGLHRDGDTLWAAADAGGLVRWSLAGGTFVQYLHPQTPLPDNTVYDVAPAVGGGVWVATARGLARFVAERDQWQVVTPATSPGMPSRVVTAVAPLADGTLWVGFAQEWDAAAAHPASLDGSVRGAFTPGGIAHFDPAANVWSQASRAEVDTVAGDPTADPKFRTIASDNVTDLALDSEGTLWVASRPYYAWDASNCHESDCLGRAEFWVLTGGGLAAMKDGTWRRWYPTSDSDTACYDRTIWSLAADADARMWAATQGHGALLMRGFGQAWSCGSGQAYYIKPRGRPDPGKPAMLGNVVRAIAVDAQTGRVWLSQGEGTDVGLGLTVLDPKGTFDDSPGSPSWFDSDDVYSAVSVGEPASRDRRVAAIVLDDGGAPIVGTIDEHSGDGDGIWQGERDAEQPSLWRWRAHRTADRGLPSNHIAGIADDPALQTTWFALKSRGVARWQRGSDTWTWWSAYRELGRAALLTSPAARGDAFVRVDAATQSAFDALFPESADYVRLGGDETIHRVMAFAPAGDGLGGRLTLSPTLAADQPLGTAVVRLTRGPAGDRATQITLRGSEPWMTALRNDRLYQLSGSPPTCGSYPDCWLDGGVAGLVDGAWHVFDPHNSPLDYREAVAVEADQAGRIWVADGNLVATGFGLAVLDPASGAWRKHQVTADFNAGNGVSDLAVDPETGHVWTAHYPVERRVAIGPGQPEQIVVAGGGVARWDGLRWKSWTKKDGGSTMGAYGDYGVYGAVTVDRPRQRVWAGGWSTLGSVFHWPRGENVHAQLDTCPLTTCRARDWVGKRWLGDGLVSALGVDPQGRLWVGTHRHERGTVPPIGGVKLLIGDAWHLLSPDSGGIPSNQITALDVDGPSAWVGTLRHGAAVYDEAVVPSATPTAFMPTAAPTWTPTTSPTPTHEPSRTPTGDATPTGPEASATPSPTDAQGRTVTPTPTTPIEATPDDAPSATAVASPTVIATPPSDGTPTRTATAVGHCPAGGCTIHLPTLWRLNRRR